MASVANDSKKGFKNGVPSADVIRSFRARHRDLTCRSYEKKELAKLKGESFEHVKTFETALKQVHKRNPNIFDQPERYWNLDETKVSGEFGTKTKVFGPADTSHGGLRATQAASGTGKHLTVVVVASEAGQVLPPFFVFAGKNQMQRWFDPLHSEIFKDHQGIPHWLTRDDWFPGDSCIVPSKNGSMEKHLLPLLIEHVNRHARKYVPSDQKIVLTLDGHSSRNGWDWLEACVDKNIEVIQSPANTSHFLQPCDQYINKTFQETIRESVDYLSKISVLDFTSMGMKLKLGICGFHSLTPSVIRESYETTGLWSMDYRFVEWSKKKEEDEINGKIEAMRYTRPVTMKRRTDLDTCQKLKDIFAKTNTPPSVRITEVSKILRQHRTIASILDDYTEDKRQSIQDIKRVHAPATMEVFSAGTPALYLTHAELIRKRKERQAAEQIAKHQQDEEKVRKQKEREGRKAAKEKKLARKKALREAKQAASRKRKAEAEEAKALKRASKKLRKDSPRDSGRTRVDETAARALMHLHSGSSSTPNYPSMTAM